MDQKRRVKIVSNDNRGAGANLDMYIGSEFSIYNATKEWMEWNSK